MIFGVVVLICLIIMGVAIYGGINNWLVSLQYQRDMGGFFDYADRASDANTKLFYFDKYMQAIKDNELTQGDSSLLFTNQPQANLANEYKVALSLQQRLIDLNQTNPETMQYHMGMQEISMTEFCWFPDNVFWQGYALKHGAWGAALMPASIDNSCATSSKSGS